MHDSGGHKIVRVFREGNARCSAEPRLAPASHQGGADARGGRRGRWRHFVPGRSLRDGFESVKKAGRAVAGRTGAMTTSGRFKCSRAEVGRAEAGRPVKSAWSGWVSRVILGLGLPPSGLRPVGAVEPKPRAAMRGSAARSAAFTSSITRCMSSSSVMPGIIIMTNGWCCCWDLLREVPRGVTMKVIRNL